MIAVDNWPIGQTAKVAHLIDMCASTDISSSLGKPGLTRAESVAVLAHNVSDRDRHFLRCHASDVLLRGLSRVHSSHE